MGEHFVIINRSAEGDPGGSRLKKALDASLALERARAYRQLLVGVVAAAGAPLWLLAAARPERLPAGLRPCALAAWVACVLGLAVAGISEWRWRRRRASSLAEPPGPPRRGGRP
jgi:hypothetical protein